MKAFFPLVLFAMVFALLAVGMTHKREAPVSPMIGKKFPVLEIEGERLDLFPLPRVAMVNVFASWCMPCKIEQPELMKLKEKNLFPVIGIAWKNKKEDAEKWLQSQGNPYSMLVLDEKGESTVALALTGVPETFLVDKQGNIAYHTKQPVTEEMMNREIIPLAERLMGR